MGLMMTMKKWTKKNSTNQNPYLVPPSVGSHGNKSEKRVLGSMDAEPTIASGSIDHHKSDGLKSVGEHDFRVECKATRNESMSLKYSWLKKIRDEAMSTGRIPVLTISFTEGDGKPKPAGDWVMMPMSLWKEISGEC